MSYKKGAQALITALAVQAVPAAAATQFGEHVTLSGFGTVGAATTDNSGEAFVRDGAPTGAQGKPSWKVDSRLGVQLDAVANSWLSGTVQALSAQRFTEDVTTKFEWAFVKIKPMQDLSVRIGRTSPAVFLISDSRNVGYANTFIRPPNEVYTLAGLSTMTGADVSYRFSLAGQSVTLGALAGRSRIVSTTYNMPADKLRGVNAQVDTRWGSFRVSHVRAVIDASSIEGPGSTNPYRFTGFGYQVDESDWVASAEYVLRAVNRSKDLINSNGWYVTGGRRFGSVLPYALLARTNNRTDFNVVNGEQRTYALGARWDVVPGAALKVQLENVDPLGSAGVSYPSSAPGTVRHKTNALSVAVDFVF